MERFLSPLPLGKTAVDDSFWGSRMDLVRQRMIPYQWEALNDKIPGAQPSHCLRNFRVAAGQEPGEHGGFVFQDSDLYKWIEAASYTLAAHPDPELRRTLTEVTQLVASAQQPDGYLNTYYIINGLDRRFTNLCDHHELYCAGHLIEAAVAHWEATGETALLDVARRLADCIGGVFGPGEGQRRGYPGHEILELALVRLWRATEEERYLHLARYLVDERGREPLYFLEEAARRGEKCSWMDGALGLEYYQAGKPVREQADAAGHAVRAVYLYAGMADVARETGDETLLQACRRLWRSVTRRRMYLTGGIGSSEYGEAFTMDYDLPNDTAYAETCAAVGLIFFARRMLDLEPKAEYADVCERALYNGALAGMSLDGTSFFYVNPLEAVPEECRRIERKAHVKTRRQKWFGCACCPPNLARLQASLGSYACSEGERGVWMHLYLGGTYEASPGDVRARLLVTSALPWEGRVTVRVEPEQEDVEWTLALRIPDWSEEWTVTVNAQRLDPPVREGYALITRAWRFGDEVSLTLDVSPRLVRANPAVREDAGKAAVMRGPLVYCLEEADNAPQLHRLRLDPSAGFQEAWEPQTLGGVVTLECGGFREGDQGWEDGALYRAGVPVKEEAVRLRWVPYYAWANREEGELLTWVRCGRS